MPTYATLFSHPAKGKENVDTIPTDLFPRAQEITQELGGETKQLYFGSMGEYDGVAILEFPDGKSIEQFRIAFEQEGTHHFENYEVFPAEEYFEMIEEATS